MQISGVPRCVWSSRLVGVFLLSGSQMHHLELIEGRWGEALLMLHAAQKLKNSDCKLYFFCFYLGWYSPPISFFFFLVTVDFRTLRIPLSLSPSLYIIACMMKTLLWTPAPLSGRGGGAGLLNSVRTLQYLEKSLDCCSNSSATTPQFFFFGTRAAILFCWLFLTLTENTSAVAVHLHWQKQISLTLTSSLWSQKFLFSYRYLVCTVALLNRLYSCVGGRILHHLFGIKKNSHHALWGPDFPDVCSVVPEIRYVYLCAPRPGWQFALFLFLILKKKRFCPSYHVNVIVSLPYISMMLSYTIL